MLCLEECLPRKCIQMYEVTCVFQRIHNDFGAVEGVTICHVWKSFMLPVDLLLEKLHYLENWSFVAFSLFSFYIQVHS